MEPKQKFPVERATTVIRELLESRLSDVHYDPDKCIALAKTLANDIREHIKELYVIFGSFCPPPPPYIGDGGVKRYRDLSVCLSVCLSHGAVALGAQLP